MKGAIPNGANSRTVGKVSFGLETDVNEEGRDVIVCGTLTGYTSRGTPV